ncbi:MAG: hypothetical protein ACJ8CR_00025 [Roseiflexaceae bacterium]
MLTVPLHALIWSMDRTCYELFSRGQLDAALAHRLTEKTPPQATPFMNFEKLIG